MLVVWLCFNLAENPYAIAVEKDGIIDAFVGEDIVVKFYASGLPPLDPDSITWAHDGSTSVSWGSLSSDKRSLTIPNIQLQHAGKYKFRVLQVFGLIINSYTATTTVNVLGKPKVWLYGHFCMYCISLNRAAQASLFPSAEFF